MNLDSIKLRVTLFIVAITTTLLTVFGAYNYYVAKDRMTANLEKGVDNALGRLQLSLPSPIWNFELESVEKIIESELAGGAIVEVRLKNGEELIAHKSRNEVDAILDKEGTDLKVYKTIKSELFFTGEGDNKKVADIELDINNDEILEALNSVLVSQVLQILILDSVIVGILYLIISGAVIYQITKVTAAVKEIAEGDGDLTKRIKIYKKNEIGELGEQVNRFINDLQVMVKKITHMSVEMEDSARTSKNVMARMNDNINEQRTDIDMVATASTQLASTTEVVVEHAETTANTTKDTATLVDESYGITKSAIDVINGLSNEIRNASEVVTLLEKETNNIGAVSDVIQGIAEQTNLLALNAAIEAARAGEQGRGFAVVADEVRTLAQRTQDSTTEINQMIERLSEQTKQVVSVMDRGTTFTEQGVNSIAQVGEKIQGIHASIDDINNMNIKIAESSREQNHVISELNRNIVRISEVAECTGEMAEETTAASEESMAQAEGLKRLMSRFKV